MMGTEIDVCSFCSRVMKSARCLPSSNWCCKIRANVCEPVVILSAGSYQHNLDGE